MIEHIGAEKDALVLFVMFDEETERLARRLGLEVALPPVNSREESIPRSRRLGSVTARAFRAPRTSWGDSVV